MRSLFIPALFVAVFCAGACQKKGNWNCSCGLVGSSTTTYTTTIENATKANASDLCNKYGGQYMPNGSYACNISAQ